MAKCRRPIVVLSILVLSVAWGFAQSTGSIQGTVKDQSGGAMPGVAIEITNTGTGISRTVVTNDIGRFDAEELQIGNYEIKAELAGFKTAQTQVTLNVGASLVVDLELEVGQIEQVVEVSGAAQRVETTRSEVTELVDSTTMRELPLNGRNYASLATLQVGVANSERAAQGTNRTIAGTGMRFNVNGARYNQNSFILDGQNIQDFFEATPASAGGDTLGVETLQEFEVKTSSFSAENSKAAGSVVNAVTKSGTNELHGSGFWFHRNDNLDSANFFDNSTGLGKPEFKRNQFGATAGGPIAKNKAFWFFGYEGLRQGLGTSNTFTVPTEAAKAGMLPNATTGQLEQVPIDPRIKPYLALFPFKSQRDLNATTGEVDVSRTNTKRSDFVVAKGDIHITQNHSLSVRYTLDDGSLLTANDGTIFQSTFDSRNQFFSVQGRSIFSPTILNTATFGVNRSELTGLDDPLISIPDGLNFVPTDRFDNFKDQIGLLNITGFTGLGNSILRPRSFDQFIYEVSDTLAMTRGAHSIKFGGNIQFYRPDAFNALWPFGQYTFSSWDRFLSARPASFFGLQPGKDPLRQYSQEVIGAFVQDDWKVAPTVTVNLGLRYELATVPTEASDKLANVKFLNSPVLFCNGDATGFAPSICAQPLDDLYDQPGFKNFAPRVGLAWDITGDGKTSLRIGGGVFYSHILVNHYRTAQSGNPPFSAAVTIFGKVPFPDASALPPRPTPSVWNTPGDPDATTSYQWNLTLQRELAADTVLSISYVGSSAEHLPRSLSGQDANIADPTAIINGSKFFRDDNSRLPRRNTAFGTIRTSFYDGNSSYQSLQLGVRRRMARGFQFQSSYTYSHSLDEASGIWGGAADFSGSPSPQDILSISSEKAHSAFDVRHNFVTNFNWDLPTMDAQGFAAGLINGWQISSITTLAGGFPFTLTSDGSADPDGDNSRNDLRPNLISGGNSNPTTGKPSGFVDVSNFSAPGRGFFGNLGRNTLRADGFVNFDLAFKKQNSLGEHAAVQFRVEIFNIFNHANFSNPSNTEIFLARGVPRPNPAIVRRTTNSARQIQLALKIVF